MYINGHEFTIGADPEIFMGDNGNFVSAHDKIPGNKFNPHPVDKGAVQVDGMALEFNISPANNFEEFSGNLEEVQSTLKDMIEGYDFLEQVSVEFDENFLENVPKSALVLGCEADFNGWSMRETPKPSQNNMMRTAGGHIHIGGFTSSNEFSPKHFNHCGRFARILDETLGVYSVLWDKDDKRRSMYGKAGSFRPKKYGVEYRTLSNKWIFNKNLVKFVYDSVEEAINLMFDLNYEPDPNIKSIINNSDRESSFFNGNAKAEKLRGIL